MTRATLAAVLGPALRGGYAVPGFVCLGWEDARAFVAAAETEAAPVILQAGPGCRAHTPLSVIGAMFRHLADEASVPVVLHLDHGDGVDVARAAIAEGFTSVMFDGSTLPLDENIRKTAEIAHIARSEGVSCEGEIGFVGYEGGAVSRLTDPADAARFAAETGIDAMAVAVGNVHLQTVQSEGLDVQAVAAIEAATGARVPLVIHGGSGVPLAQRQKLSRQSAICKFNIGTEVRQTFGATLRSALDADPKLFDRISILKATEPALMQNAQMILRDLGASGQV